MKGFVAFFVLLLSLYSVLSLDDCTYLKQFCNPPCNPGQVCMYDVVLYTFNCFTYEALCLNNNK